MSNVIPQNSVEFLYLSTPLIPVFGLTVLIISTTNRINNFTLHYRLSCIAVIYHTIMHTAQQSQWYFDQICTHEWHRKPSPNGWAMGWVSFMSHTKKNYRDISRTHWVANSTWYDLCWITCHKQSLFSSVSKKQYTSHELTWWYWHIHAALCSTLFKVMSTLIFQTFPQKWRFLWKFRKKFKKMKTFWNFPITTYI